MSLMTGKARHTRDGVIDAFCRSVGEWHRPNFERARARIEGMEARHHVRYDAPLDSQIDYYEAIRASFRRPGRVTDDG